MRQVVSALLLSALAMGATACQSAADGDRTPPSPAAAEAAPPDAKASGTGRTGSRGLGTRAPALIGDTVDLGGRAFGEHLRVSALGYVDPARSVRTAHRPAAGKRWVGVDLSAVNVGGTSYDARITKAWVTDDKGRRHPVIRTGEITTGFPAAWNTLAAGEHAEGWLVFEVPENARIMRFHSTVGDSPLTWQLQLPPSR
ncbi:MULTISPECIES: DUF4352 domain-containing protein [Streptomyces]|uniref:DUF4352 domain-containing protein n=1 Tax=Streptomyces achmelvichensis TaxID=3134111 RepID=A0ACC6Q0I0_9ACTN|nr:DUF4352 domain-containing protein [Streptomyces sp. NBC_01167]